ncbi:MAG: LAGLIDADG family homing endonuclease [Candidatus Niyogibacteria bacterium]|nr:LAGLIDADG family homing endonuclease [Candidatus Niyogibacteria bacterium]
MVKLAGATWLGIIQGMSGERQNKVGIVWSPAFAYAIGLLTTDGNLSKDGRHMELTSKDREIITTFKKCLGIKNRVSKKARGQVKAREYFRIQFGDKNFYAFLLSIGLKPAKSKILDGLKIPDHYFRDFLRGCIDGDGNINVFIHPESRHPQLRTRLVSASPPFLRWVKQKIYRLAKINGGWIEVRKHGIPVLVYAKSDSVKLLNFMYYPKAECFLKRKYEVAQPFLRV